MSTAVQVAAKNNQGRLLCLIIIYYSIYWGVAPGDGGMLSWKHRWGIHVYTSFLNQQTVCKADGGSRFSICVAFFHQAPQFSLGGKMRLRKFASDNKRAKEAMTLLVTWGGREMFMSIFLFTSETITVMLRKGNCHVTIIIISLGGIL